MLRKESTSFFVSFVESTEHAFVTQSSIGDVRLRPGLLRDMQERDRVYLYVLPNDRLLRSFSRRLVASRWRSMILAYN